MVCPTSKVIILHTYLVDLSEERQQVQDSQANFCGYIGLSVYMVDNVYFIGVAYKMQNKTVHQHKPILCAQYNISFYCSVYWDFDE